MKESETSRKLASNAVREENQMNEWVQSDVFLPSLNLRTKSVMDTFYMYE